MGERIRTIAVLLVVLAAGALLGSAIEQGRAARERAVTETRPRGQAPPGQRIRVEVLNAAGRKNIARDATDLLRDRGYDVVYFGNAERFDREASVVLDRVGTLEIARRVADALGIRNVQSVPDSNLYLDVSVLLGRDWTRPLQDSTPAARRPWWDLPALWERLRGGGEKQRGGAPESVTDPGERSEIRDP